MIGKMQAVVGKHGVSLCKAGHDQLTAKCGMAYKANAVVKLVGSGKEVPAMLAAHGDYFACEALPLGFGRQSSDEQAATRGYLVRWEKDGEAASKAITKAYRAAKADKAMQAAGRYGGEAGRALGLWHCRSNDVMTAKPNKATK